MKPQTKDRKEVDLLEQLAKGADEVAHLIETKGMRTYSRINGKLRPNVPPVYQKHSYPFFTCVSIIQVLTDPDTRTANDLEITKALDRACVSAR